MATDAPFTSDEQLVSNLAAGDAAALEVLAGRYERSLVGLARGMLNGSHDLAGEAVQETWIRVIRFSAGFRDKSSAKTWLYRILLNQCRSLNRNGRRPARSDTDAIDRVADSKPADPPDGERLERLRAAVSRLNEDQQALVLLCYHEGMTHPQAAAVLDWPLGTLKSRLHTALAELRRLLADREEP
ncbi:MAG: sigma-70 family RNA polymerase sigma factor [Planctomycetes bacterium]|nr:sigma-70 family RNA polymerase sigma factor [Planctomycetota bacterium]